MSRTVRRIVVSVAALGLLSLCFAVAARAAEDGWANPIHSAATVRTVGSAAAPSRSRARREETSRRAGAATQARRTPIAPDAYSPKHRAQTGSATPER